MKEIATWYRKSCNVKEEICASVVVAQLTTFMLLAAIIILAASRAIQIVLGA